MNTELEQVIIDDDNDSIETVEILEDDTDIDRRNKNSPMEIDTINLDEESQQCGTSCLIEVDGTSSRKSDIKSEESFSNLLRNNRLMSKLVKKCLNMKNSDGMTRVIHKTVLPIYKDTDSNFKESALLRRAIKSTLRMLELNPSNKFSYMKSLCDLLQSKRYKKKVPFITLGPLPENNNASKVFNKNDDNHIKSNLKKTDIIDLVNSDKDSIIILDSNEGENDVIILDEESDITCQTSTSNNSNKENNRSKDKNHSKQTSHNNLIQSNKGSPNASVENKLQLRPSIIHAQEDYSNKKSIEEEVKIIEATIAMYQNQIAMLEKQEVTDCSKTSPYLQCDMWKKNIVQLYEEICKLTGEEPVKRREVRLEVTAGHPPGPVKRLEEFLNKNIDSTGSPPFPDFYDVIKCVQMANSEDGLGWRTGQIMKEALALFTQCGHALRRRRQKREWRDLMSLVKQEQLDEDPADKDPELSARLQENKKIAKEKERQIFERFTQMEYLPIVSSLLNPRLGNMDAQDPHDETTDTDSETEQGNVETSRNSVDNCELTRNPIETCDINVGFKQNVSSNTNVGTANVVNATNVVDHTNVVDAINVVDTTNVVETTNVVSELPVQIKQEPVDIQRLLDGLGSDYTVSVCDIEDPFMVIDISSDSSYSDDDDSEHTFVLHEV